MGIMRIGAAALVIAGGVVLAERTTTLDKAYSTITGTAAGPVTEAIGFCQRQPELCTAAATAGVAAATASLVAPSLPVAPPAAVAPVAPPQASAPSPVAAKTARPSVPKTVQQPAAKASVPRAAAVPLPPQRPAALGKARPPA